MAEKVCGFKDSRGEYFDTEYKAKLSEFKWDVYYATKNSQTCPYTANIVTTYLTNKYNLLDRPTVPFWKTII